MTIELKVVVSPTDPTRGTLRILCEKGFEGVCRFPIWRGEAGGTMWHWDGNVDKPSITPSVACQACDKHFVVTNGVAS